MKYPALLIDTKKLKENTEIVVGLCKKHHIQCAAVTKAFCAIPEVAKAFVDGGVYMLADSRIENLKKLKDLPVPKVLLRIPMLCEVEDVVNYADISQNSELTTISAISDYALSQNKIHKVVLMVDLGDLREGVWNTEAVNYAGEILKFKGVQLVGISTNLTCYGAVIPSGVNIGLLCDIADEIEKKYNIKLDIVSGGNSSSIYLLENGEMPKKVNQLRPGEALLLGSESAYGKRIEGTVNDAFIISAQIIELKEKQSMPIGEIGVDAFGGKPSFVDRGVRKRAILGIGRQDIKWDDITPIDKSIIILGASSDHLIVDISDCYAKYSVGDCVSFTVGYGALLAASTSPYVEKVITH